MILGDITTITISILTGVELLVMALLILVIMMQRPKQEGLGAAFGSAMTDQVFGARTTDVLQKMTRNLAIAFVLIALALSIFVTKKNSTESLVAEVTEEKVEATEEPAVEEIAPEILKDLQGTDAEKASAVDQIKETIEQTATETKDVIAPGTSDEEKVPVPTPGE